jgi:hypothetical protein
LAAHTGAVVKLLIILAFAGALANGVARSQEQPPLLIDNSSATPLN